jgi:hypothetical protein
MTYVPVPTRAVNIRRERYDILIMRPGPWGNPFVVGVDGEQGECVRKHREWLETGNGFGNPRANSAARQFVVRNIGRLKGKKLGCGCKPKACHGDTLAEFADR